MTLEVMINDTWDPGDCDMYWHHMHTYQDHKHDRNNNETLAGECSLEHCNHVAALYTYIKYPVF